MRHKLSMAAGMATGLLLIFSITAQGQLSGAGGNATAKGGPEGNSGVGNQANYAKVADLQHGGMVFRGNVKIENAALPWDAIPVVVSCNGIVRYRTLADPNGRFTIQGNEAPSELVPTKGNPHQQAASQLIGCDAEGDLPGFTSSKLYIMNGNIMDDPNIGTITLRPDNSAAGTSASATTAAAPADAMKKFDKARAEFLSGHASGAEHDLQKAVKADPNFAEAWYQLGKLQQAKDPQAALNSYQKAAAADPKFVSPYEPIAELSATQKKWQDVVNATSAAFKLDPTGTPQLWYYDALAKFNLGKTDEAEASARKSLAMDPQHMAPNTEQLLAVLLASQGDLEGALKHLQNSLTYIKTGPNVAIIQQQIAQLKRAMPQDSGK